MRATKVTPATERELVGRKEGTIQMLASRTVELDGKHVTLEAIEEIALRGGQVAIAPAARAQIALRRAT